MAIDTENKRRSVHGYTNSPILPVADASIDQLDRQMVAWIYSGITAGPPPGVNLMAQTRQLFRRVHSRVFGRVN